MGQGHGMSFSTPLCPEHSSAQSILSREASRALPHNTLGDAHLVDLANETDPKHSQVWEERAAKPNS